MLVTQAQAQTAMVVIQLLLDNDKIDYEIDYV